MVNNTEDVKPSEPPVTETPQNLPQKKITPKKELVLGLGALVMIVVLSLVYVKWFSPKTPIPVVPTAEQTTKVLTLSLESPTDGELAVNDEILVSGKTLPNTTVVVFTENDETSFESDAAGYFESTIKLINGINQLVVTAFADDGQEKAVILDVVHDSEV